MSVLCSHADAPQLISDPLFSPDGAVATVVVSFDSHLSNNTFTEEDYQVQIKLKWLDEWKIQRRFSGPYSEANRPLYHTSNDNESATRQISISVVLDCLNKGQEKSCYFRVISQRQGTLCLPSNSLQVKMPCLGMLSLI